MPSIRMAGPHDLAVLLDIWRTAVLATHGFLSQDDFTAIEKQVAHDYLPNTPLWVAVDAADRPLGFLGRTGANVDTLFVHAEARGRGVGRALLEHARHGAGEALTVDVNAQNTQALGFYARQGFVLAGASPRDSAGRPYPLLHLRQAPR